MTITESAVTKRIRRKLKTTSYMLRKARGERQQVDCGRYYVIDANMHALLWHHVNIESYAHEAWRSAGERIGGRMNKFVRKAGTWIRPGVNAAKVNPSLCTGQLAEGRSVNLSELDGPL